MFSYLRFIARNPSYVTRNARASWDVRKAMNEFRELPENKFCAWCGRSEKLEVHHIKPVSVAPAEAADPKNMIMLCRKSCHITVGHNSDYKNYVGNVKRLCDQAWRIKTVERQD